MFITIGKSLPTIVLAIILVALSTHGSAQNPWEEIQRPSSQPPASIGQYTNGCLSGAKQMPLRGEGFQLVRTGRNRHYGHPIMVAFLTEFSAKVAHNQLGRLQIGDISMARGGPFTSGHRSHQLGLDADIWFSQDARASKRPLSAWERDNISAHPLADARNHKLITKSWNKKVPKILRLAAEDARVERIFVHPTIKRKLCRSAGENKEWLRKLRPWWGHNYHFHVRLSCPPGSRNCKPQTPVTGDPCGTDLDWWFSESFYAILNGTVKKAPKKRVAKPPIPIQCEQVLIAP